MNLGAERQDFQAAGALADELPYWGWLKAQPFCLTRAGELFAVARMAPAVIDGRTPDQLDQILGRWQRVLSGLDPRTRLYFYLLRRPASLLAPEGLEGVAQLSQENRRAFLLPRVQDLRTYVVWCTNPGLEQAAAHGPAAAPGPWTTPATGSARAATPTRAPTSPPNSGRRPSASGSSWTRAPRSPTT